MMRSKVSAGSEPVKVDRFCAARPRAGALEISNCAWIILWMMEYPD